MSASCLIGSSAEVTLLSAEPLAMPMATINDSSRVTAMVAVHTMSLSAAGRVQLSQVACLAVSISRPAVCDYFDSSNDR